MKFIVTVAVVMAVLPGLATCEPPALSFAKVVQESLSSGPGKAKIGATLAAKAAEAFGAGVKSNPVLDLNGEIPVDEPSAGREDTGVTIAISQALRQSDFGARAELASLIHESARADQVVALNELIGDLALAYARAWQFQETIEVIKDSRERIQKTLRGVTVNQASKGAFSEGDVELLRSEAATFEADEIAARGRLASARAELIRLTGTTLPDVQCERPGFQLRLSKSELEERVLASRLPLQQRVGLMRRVAAKRLEVAKLDRFPAITPQLGYAHHDDGSNLVTVGVSVPLAFYNKNEGVILEAEGDTLLAEQGSRYMESGAILSEAMSLYSAIEQLERQISILEGRALPAKKRAVEAYGRQFDVGGASVFQMWQAQRDLNDARLRTIAMFVDLAEARAKLMVLAGDAQY